MDGTRLVLPGPDSTGADLWWFWQTSKAGGDLLEGAGIEFEFTKRPGETRPLDETPGSRTEARFVAPAVRPRRPRRPFSKASLCARHA